MARSTALKNALANAYAAVAHEASLHSGDPGTTGANEVTSTPRVTLTWGAASGGSVAATSVTFTITSTVNLTHVGIWNSSGVFLENIVNAVSVAAGTYTITLEYVEP